MLFNSYEFLFLFLPVTLTGFYGLGRRVGLEWALGLLVLASLVFYSYWNPIYLPLLLISMAVNYLIVSRLNGAQESPARRKRWVTAGVTFNLALLGYFKYANFGADSWNAIAAPPIELPEIALPLAISFFTFQQIAYVVDAFKHPGRRTNALHYAFFVTFFPQLIAGPIVRHDEVLPQLRKRVLLFDSQSFAVGLTLFVFGLFKKVVLADNIAEFSSPVFDALPNGVQPEAAPAWLAVFAYSLQLYFDFSGYSDMAIGLGRMFNIRMPANFESPYKAENVGEFWRRWHVTLSRFLKEYLYIPLGGNRGTPLRVSFNLLITMVLGGLWHGAGWGFVLWGFVNGVFLVVYRLYYDAMKRRCGGKVPKAQGLRREIAITVTFLLVMMSRVSFRAPDWDSSLLMYEALAGVGHGSSPPDGPSLRVGLAVCFGAYFVCRVMPNSHELLVDHHPVLTGVRAGWLRVQPDARWALAVAAALLISVLSLGEVSEFLYFQF